MKIIILGAGPAGLYSGLLIKKANPANEITLIERIPADETYGWGVDISDRTLASFQRADYKTYEQITSKFVIWDSIDATEERLFAVVGMSLPVSRVSNCSTSSNGVVTS